MDKGDKRRQLNIRLDDELFEIIDDLRAMVRPIPHVSDIVRQALRNERDRVRRRTDADAVRS
jgi:Arc/MetJ-type ribon-helix-helix transcriptional regulator